MGETVNEYYDAIVHLYKKVDPDKAYPDADCMRQFIDRLRDELREPVEMSLPNNLQEAYTRATAAEAAFSRNMSLGAYSMKRSYMGQMET